MNIQLKQEKKVFMPAVKLGTSRQIVIPKKFYDALQLAPGDYLEVELSNDHRLLITPKELVDKHSRLEKRLAEAEEDVDARRVSGPFKTAAELARHLKSIRA